MLFYLYGFVLDQHFVYRYYYIIIRELVYSYIFDSKAIIVGF